MRKKRVVALTAAASAVALTAAACGNNSGGSSSAGSSGYNAALTSIVNQSSTAGGTLKLEDSSGFDSLDGGITYEASTWDLYRLFDRTMMSFKQEPGKAGLELQGDLVSSFKASNNNKTWTYTIVPNAKFANGDTITTKDVAYAIERSNFDASGTIHGGPAYFANLIQNNNNYQGPYKDPSGQVSGISTPNATTITFNLTKPFADFNYLMTLLQTAPVEPTHDPGAQYSTDLAKDTFSGQYTVSAYTPNSSLTLVPNTAFDSSSDPNGVHKRYASKIQISLDVNTTTVDQNLLNGSSGLDVRGIGVGTGTQSIVLANPKDKANSDVDVDGFETFMSVNTQVQPLNNVYCRQAIEYAVNKAQVQDVSGGSIAGGAVANTILPTTNTGYAPSTQYATGGNEGDTGKATSLFNQCKAAEGSSFNPAFTLATYKTSDNPKMIAAADVIQQNLDKVGFKVTIAQYSYGDGSFWNSYAGLPSYADSNRIGLSLWAWGADFPTGYGYMDEILTGDGINKAGGSYNLSYWTDNKFNSLMSNALAASTPAQSQSYYAQADAYAMSQAVIVPLLYQSTLLYRPTTTTNLTVSEAYGMYDYSIIGTSNK
jgi:peptide/nickel transport system substrate-binding protein